jgi:hypothetical protein
VGRSGDSKSVKALIEEFNLDVNASEPQHNKKQRQTPNRQRNDPQHETLLHVAAKSCDESLVLFLISRGMRLTIPCKRAFP